MVASRFPAAADAEREETTKMKHLKCITSPAKAIDWQELPVDLQFLIDLMVAFAEKKANMGT